MGLAGERVLLAYPPGLDFIEGFLGCLYAGCTAVPTDLPHRRTLDRFRAISLDADARLVLSTGVDATRHRAAAGTGGGHSERLPPIPWLATDGIADALAERWREPGLAPDALAVLQYTSGSTSQPKGVMIVQPAPSATMAMIAE